MVNSVALFFVCGIGIDHIFVFTDAWHQAKSPRKALSKGLSARVSSCYYE